jgi:hypothetical protein
MVEAVLVLPDGRDLRALMLVAPGTALAGLGALRERLDSVQEVLGAAGATVHAVTTDPEALGRDVETCHRVIAFGTLLAGRLPASVWEQLEAVRGPLPTLTVAALAADAPTAFARLALTLMTRGPCPGPLDAIVALLAEGVAPRQLADPETFSLRWAGLMPGVREPLDETILLARSAARPAAPGELAHLVEHGRALAHACAKAVRASGLGRADPVAQRLWREALGPGMPRVLLPALGARLAEVAAAGRLRLDPVRVGRSYEVRLLDGTYLGRGASPVQARVRALGLLADAARGEHGRALFDALDSTWRAVGQRLSRPRERAALVLMPVAGGGARPGPPMDLLNRGPERSIEFEGALAVLLVPGRRPSGRMLGAEEAVRAVLCGTPSGAALELLPSHASARPVAARLAQIAALLRDGTVTGPIAVEAGGRVLVPEGLAVRSFSLARFAARPRIFTPDPEAPDISITTGERHGPRSRPSGFVQCRVVLVDADTAALLYADDTGTHLREEAPLSELEERLREAREIVRAAAQPAVLAVRLSDGLEQAVRRAGPPGAPIAIAVRGALPFVEVVIEGERFGGTSSLGWGAAAEALLARWPTGGEGVVGVNAVTATARGVRLPPLLALYASSVARRRLRTHVAAAMASYRTAATGRREG